MMKNLFWVMLPIVSLLMVSCSSEDEGSVNVETFESFYPKYNRYIENWLSKQEETISKKISELTVEIAEANEEEAKALGAVLAEQERSLTRIRFRKGLGDYFRFSEIAELPAGLTWEDGTKEPEIGDERAKKGGTFNSFILGFPPTLRPIGPESNNSFRGNLYDQINIALVNLHPETLGVIPGLAKEWAVSEDQKTVYFKLNADATYTDGVPVEAIDFFYSLFIRLSDNISAPYPKQYFREQYAQLTIYDKQTLAITLADAKPLTPYYASLTPAPRHFYSEFGPDYRERYNWRVPPSTGAYYVKDEDIVKGVSITLSRDPDWWAKDKKFYRYRFNADRLRYLVIRDLAKAFELFKAGEIDYFGSLSLPNYWYDKSQAAEFFDGFIEKHEFYHRFPHIPRGLYLNVNKGLLKDREVRLGLQHAINFQKVIDVIFRGDSERLDQMVGGFRDFTDPSIKARRFSVTQARQYFREAGFVETGSDGILKRSDGTRLSVAMSYPQVSIYPKLAPILKEEALKAGLEIRLEGSEPTLNFEQTMKKEHEMVLTGWGVGPPVPKLFQFLHSSNAFDVSGNPKQQTNNIFSYANDEMDRYVLGLRHASTVEEIKENAWKAQRLLHEEAIFIPGWRTPFARVGSWRWLRWPDSEETEFASSLFDRPIESFAWWIDEEVKEETQEAKREGEVFEEVTLVHDRHRELKERSGDE